MTATERSKLVAEIVDEILQALDLDARVCALESYYGRPTPHITQRRNDRHLHLVTDEARAQR